MKYFRARKFMKFYITRYSDDGPVRHAALPSLLLAVPNVTAHASSASVLTSSTSFDMAL